MIYFHGYMSSWPPRKTSYREVSERENFLVVFPRGMGDFGGIDNSKYLGWNTGEHTDVTPEQSAKTCWAKVGKWAMCADSCNPET